MLKYLFILVLLSSCQGNNYVRGEDALMSAFKHCVELCKINYDIAQIRMDYECKPLCKLELLECSGQNEYIGRYGNGK